MSAVDAIQMFVGYFTQLIDVLISFFNQLFGNGAEEEATEASAEG